ncbi:MAG: amidohydrolase family protein, partial [Okeania sp. SIO2D1]|nr:amidohydrolase family protein [Okeania sp. SIO2D1]
PYLTQIIDYIGSDNLIFGSDYPHMDHRPDLVKNIVELEKNLSQEITNKIVWDNPKCFYKV